MRYAEFVKHLVAMSGHPEEVVREVLMNVPDALMLLGGEDTLHTPLGTFRVVTRKSRMVKLPSGEEFPAVSETAIKLKPGARLRSR